MIELVDPNDARAIRNKDNILSLYDLMINKKEAEQAVAIFFAPKYIQHNPLVPDGAAELARFFDKIAKDSCQSADRDPPDRRHRRLCLGTRPFHQSVQRQPAGPWDCRR